MAAGVGGKRVRRSGRMRSAVCANITLCGAWVVSSQSVRVNERGKGKGDVCMGEGRG